LLWARRLGNLFRPSAGRAAGLKADRLAGLWAKKTLAVHDVTVNDGVIIAGTEDGDLYAFDGAGKRMWSKHLGAPVIRLAIMGAAGTLRPSGHGVSLASQRRPPLTADSRPLVVAGLADGQLSAFAVR
jgi:outer membrane protein assembly factor BamB